MAIGYIRRGITGGRVEALVEHEGDEAPGIVVSCRGRPVEGVELAPVAGRAGLWRLAFPIPPQVLSDGLAVILVSDRDSGAVLDRVPVLVGDLGGEGLAGEVALLAEEVALLKSVLRRHLAETEDRDD